MELSSPRFKALAVTFGLTLWFSIITTTVGIFSVELFGVFVISVITITQVFSVKLSKALDIFAIVNTKVFLGILFVSVISLYGIFFRILRIDLLRLKKRQDTYWLEMEQLKQSRIFKQY